MCTPRASFQTVKLSLRRGEVLCWLPSFAPVPEDPARAVWGNVMLVLSAGTALGTHGTWGVGGLRRESPRAPETLGA